MADLLLTQTFPPIHLSAARRLLESITVDLDLPAYQASGLLEAKVRLSPEGESASLALRSDPSGILASCALCRTEQDLPCTHAIAVLLIFRERTASRYPLPPALGKSLPSPPFRTSREDTEALRELPCLTLLLAGTRQAPFFVALTRRMTPMDHRQFRLLEAARGRGEGSLPLPALLFCRAFEPHPVKEGDGRAVSGYRPRNGERESFSRYLALPGVRILSARTKNPYRIESPLHCPPVRLMARWADQPGGEVLLEGEVEIGGRSRPVRDALLINFEQFSLLVGGGSLLFLAREAAFPPMVRRLMERAGDSRPLSPAEWAPYLDPEMGEGGPVSVEFHPPELKPLFGSRSRWRPALRLTGRSGGGLLLTPELQYPDEAAIPLFGPERHRLGNYLPGKDRESSFPLLLPRDREKELLARNLFEKVARLSSSSAAIPADLSQTGEILDQVVPDLEALGFFIDKSEFYDGSILPGPVHVSLAIRDISTQEVDLFGQVSTGAGTFPLPGRPPDGTSSLLPLPSGVSVYLEGMAREHDREICQLFALDGDGRGRASRYYVSMIRMLRPDLPLIADPGVKLRPFSPSHLPDEDFERLGKLFLATLRPYQKEAISTLVSLRREGLSGILADEMGLGKTVSILGFLSYLKMENPEMGEDSRPPLVVLPASLLFNWAHEASRFSPELRLHIHAGLSRQTRIREMEKADLVLTTYGTLRNDSHLSLGPPFSCLILDEAHTVKNPESRTHQALLSLPASQRILVTGTPVENRLSDLWGIMNLLMPGLLGSRLQFERRFLRENALGEEQNRRIALLGNLVAPLVLRRTKEMVLTELPPKVEVDLWIDPTPEEKSQYERLRNHGKEEILLSDGSRHMAYLTLLLRLRQFVCHPALLPPELQGGLGGSSKFDLVCDKISEGVSEGHKILLFSQFTGILDLFEQVLPGLGIAYVRLDGSTPLEERKRRVEAFQDDDPGAPMLFLASLKAGGVGLTLTQADYVFHYDPWWNPQVESQASDRSHRIGQRKTVFVYRFLVRESVEERVQTLKESKKELFDRLMTFGAGSGEDDFRRLSLEDMINLVDDSSTADK